MSSSAIPRWKLSDLYRSIKDKKIAKDFSRLEIRAKSFNKKYRGKLATRVKTADSLLAILKEIENLQQEMAKPVVFASLEFSCSQNDPKTGAFVQAMRQRWTEINKHLQFFELELAALPEKKIIRFAQTSRLALYQNYIKRLFASRRHMLKEQEEQIFSDFSLTGRGAFMRLFSEELAARRYEVKLAGKKKTLVDSEVLNLLMSTKTAERKAAATAFTTGLKDNSTRIAYIFNTLLEDKKIRDRYRKYPDCEASRHEANQIKKTMVNSMVDEVVAGYPMVQDFYRFKARVMKVKKLSYADRLAPIAKSDKKISFAKAKTLILDAFGSFSPEYEELAREFFDKSWIDAEVRAGKRSGGFCSFVTPDLHPYIFMNYRGNLRDVFTLAHELGHAIHARLMSRTSYFNFDIPLTIAETASIFSEMLLFEHLLKEYPGAKDQFSLYASSVENRFATVFRQVSMHRFEQLFHNARRELGEQSVDQINSHWVKSQKELYGSSIDFKGEYDYWWSYIPHFIHTPFYVYAYAFGELLSIALYQKYLKQGKSFVSLYLDMLASGGSLAPEDLLTPLGVNLNSKAFWRAGVANIREQVQQTKTLYKQL